MSVVSRGCCIAAWAWLAAAGCIASPAIVGEQLCPASPGFDCTVPFVDGPSWGECSATPGTDFDENCCRRPSCEGKGDCEEAQACVPAGLPVSCSDVVEDGETTCQCGVPPNGRLRPLCVNLADIRTEWCSGYWTEEECAAAEPITFGPDHVQLCRWIEVQVLSTHEPGVCELREPESRCLTIRELGNLGCGGPLPCSLDFGPPMLGDAVAHFTSESTIEAFGAGDVFCGDGYPLGDWLSADDPSFGACSFTCGY